MKRKFGRMKRRRQMVGFGLLVLIVALFVVGTVVIDIGDRPYVALFFWGVTFLVVLGALILSYMDLRSLRRTFKEEKRRLFIDTFSDEDFRRKLEEKRSETGASEVDDETSDG